MTNKSYINKAYGILAGNYKPNEEGYTTLVVTVKNSWKPNPNNMSENLDKDQTMSYIAEAIESVQILTDLSLIQIQVLFTACRVAQAVSSLCLKVVVVNGTRL